MFPACPIGVETPPLDRRGPLRPGRLIPSRERLRGETMARAFRGMDMAGLLALAWLVHDLMSPAGVWTSPVAQAAPYFAGAALLAAGLSLAQAYDFGARERLAAHLARIVSAAGLTGALLGVMLLAAHAPGPLFEGLSAFVALAFAWLYGAHAWAWSFVRRLRRSGRLAPSIVLVGATANAERLIARALRDGDVAVLGVFDDRVGRTERRVRGVPVLGDTSALIGHRIMPYVDRVVITVSSTAQARVRALVDKLRVLPNDVALFVDFEAACDEGVMLSRLADIPLAQLSGGRDDPRRAEAKRLQDLILGGLALIVAAPIMVLVALAVKLDSAGPVFFRQRRQGFNNEEFVVWKFRSMRHELRDETCALQVQPDDARVTRVGRFIRATSLDELPQLFNVLAGQMSLVGPRPHAPGMKTGEIESALLVAEYAHRHRIKPGLTGWAAIKGSRGPLDTAEAVRRRIALDIDYIGRQSLWFDLYIMAMTLPCLLGDRQAAR
jgi:Undecaprenyl-phosphate glucose phosphotransferase